MLLAVDRYNALYAPSEYGQTVGELGRRLLDPGELRLARALRLTEHSAPKNGASLVAMARNDRVSFRVPVRSGVRASLFWHVLGCFGLIWTPGSCAWRARSA